MNKRKVLFVIHQLNHGGVQKSLISALNAIDYSENEVTLYIRKNRVDFLENINKNVNKIIINNDNTHYYRKPYMVWLQVQKYVYNLIHNKKKVEELKEKISVCLNQMQMNYEKNHYFNNENSYDVAISYIQGYNALFVADYVNAKRKYVYFHTSTDDLHELHAKILPKFDKALALHSEQEKKLVEWHDCLNGKTTIIENYTDTETIVSQSKSFTVEKPDNKTVLCSCGRFSPVKGFDLAVDAAKRLKDNGLNFIWYFVGDGPERKKIENLISKYNLHNEIVLTGMQNNPYPYMAACDIYVQPSYEEAQPLTILEVQRLNKPTVTTATVGGNALIKNGVTGLICEIGSDAISESIMNLSNDKKFYSEIKANLESIDYSHEFEKYKTQWKKLLEE